jgi:hypothetical protein
VFSKGNCFLFFFFLENLIMVTAISGLRGPGEFSSDFRPTNYRETFSLLEPNGSAPFSALLVMTQGEATDDPIFSVFRDEMPERVVKVNNSSGYNATATTITIDADSEAAFLVAGSLLCNPATGEVMRVSADTAKNGTSITVVRNLGTASAALTIADNQDLFVCGFAAEDGADIATSVSFDPVVVQNFCQIFRTSFAITNTLKQTYRRTGDAEDEFSMKALKLHMQEIERAMFFGHKHSENAGANNERRYTNGILNSLTNVVDGASFTTAGLMTEDEFDSMLIDTVFAFGGSQKIAFVGAKVAAHLQRFGKARWQPTMIEGAYGVNITSYNTTSGQLLVHLHPQFRQIPSMQNAMVIIDMTQVKYRYLQGRDTQLLRDRQSPGRDSVQHEFLSDCGLELLTDKTHTYIKGWTRTV